MEAFPGIRILCIRKYQNAIRSSLWDCNLVPLLKDRHEFKITDLKIEHQNGSVLICSGLDGENAEKILGQEWATIFMNEAAQIDYKVYQLCTSRLSQMLPNLQKRTVVLDTNPKSMYHWLYRIGILHLNPDNNDPIADKDKWFRMQFTLKDNPHLPQDAVDSLKNLTGIERKRLYEGQWCSVEGLAYPEFSMEKHIKHRDWKELALSYLVGGDAGYDPDPTVLALFAIMEIEGKQCLHMCDLFYQKGASMSLTIAEACEKWRDYNPFIVFDPSASSAIVELKNKGFRCEPAINKVKEGISIVRDLIATDRFSCEPYISEKFVEEISQYELDVKTELPKGNTPDHILDCVKYASFAFQGNARYITPHFSNMIEVEPIENLGDKEMWDGQTDDVND